MKSESNKVHPEAADNDNAAQGVRETLDDRAALRAHSKKVRRGLTDTLKDHGVPSGPQFGRITNTEYRAILDFDAKQYLKRAGLKPSDSLRDALDDHDLAAIMLVEARGARRIRAEGCFGPDECNDAVRRTGQTVRRIIDLDEADFRTKSEPAANDADDKSSAA